jgi:dTDP-4-dehydrorhamnose 3,5-epimerase
MGNAINENLIQGVGLKKLSQINDERGALLHFITNESPEYSGFGEAYISKTNSGIIKGWKLHKIMSQNFIVPVGEMEFVLFDDRENSNTKGKINKFVLNNNTNYFLLTIPPKIWYSFKCVSVNEGLIFNVASIKHDPTEIETLPINNSFIPFVW